MDKKLSLFATNKNGCITKQTLFYDYRPSLWSGEIQTSLLHSIDSLESWNFAQWRSQNAEKVTHIKGRLLYQAMILYNYVPFQSGDFS